MTLGSQRDRPRPSCDEGRGVEVADAADVGIERQVAAEAQQRRHLQLDDLLPVPAGHQVEAAERREEVALRPHRHVDVGKARQAGPQQMRVAAAARRSAARRACCRASAWPAIRSEDRRAPGRPGAESCAEPGEEWLGGLRKTSSWLALKIHVGCGPSTSIAWRTCGVRPTSGRTSQQVRPLQPQGIRPTKKRRAKRPGELNREASRLGDVGS